jgi:hypothetical protein
MNVLDFALDASREACDLLKAPLLLLFLLPLVLP